MMFSGRSGRARCRGVSAASVDCVWSDRGEFGVGEFEEFEFWILDFEFRGGGGGGEEFSVPSLGCASVVHNKWER